jgi:hypothetical protein
MLGNVPSINALMRYLRGTLCLLERLKGQVHRLPLFPVYC